MIIIKLRSHFSCFDFMYFTSVLIHSNCDLATTGKKANFNTEKVSKGLQQRGKCARLK